MPHDVHRRAPIQCFLVLVLANLTWAFQFSGTKIDDRARRPNSRCLHSAGALDSAVSTARAHKPGKKPQPRWAPVLWWDLFLASTPGIIPAQFGLAWGLAHSLASNTVSDLLAKVFQLATKNDRVGAPANCAGSAPCILFGYSAQESNREKRLLPNNS
jgi:hypothetical protein